MLELGRIPGVDRDDRAIHVELPYHATPILQFRSEGLTTDKEIEIDQKE